jgi:hydrogenase/urease accessory protein HupE
MKTTITRSLLAALTLAAAAPSAAAAHEGHAGDHGWLFGALQPLLSVDHLLAGLFVAGVGAVGFAVAGRLRARAAARRREQV